MLTWCAFVRLVDCSPSPSPHTLSHLTPLTPLYTPTHPGGDLLELLAAAQGEARKHQEAAAALRAMAHLKDAEYAAMRGEVASLREQCKRLMEEAQGGLLSGGQLAQLEAAQRWASLGWLA
jgi:hypothetical protein